MSQAIIDMDPGKLLFEILAGHIFKPTLIRLKYSPLKPLIILRLQTVAVFVSCLSISGDRQSSLDNSVKMSFSNSSTSSSQSGVSFSICYLLKPASEQNKVDNSSICLCTLSCRHSRSCRLLYAGQPSSSKQKLSKSRNITTKPGVNLYFIFHNVAALKHFMQLI